MPLTRARRGKPVLAAFFGGDGRALFVLALWLAVVAVPGRALAACGDFNGDGSVSATDALGVLRSAVGLVSCDDEDCDIDGNGSISATDALSTLKAAVGQDVALACPCITDLDY